jgi:ammonia channel protein AmtB
MASPYLSLFGDLGNLGRVVLTHEGRSRKIPPANLKQGDGMNLRRAALPGLVLLAFLLSQQAVSADSGGLGVLTSGHLQILVYMVTWLLPLGVALVAVGLSMPARAQQVATSLPLALATSLGGYYLCGFAFHFGGIELAVRAPDLPAFVAEWSPLDLRLGPGWGLMGLRGFALPAGMMTESALQLFVSQLPLVTTAALIPLLSLNGRIPRLPSFFLALLVSCVCYPLMGNWVRGGGWLSHLGETLRLGRGYTDYGLGSLHLVGGFAALAGIVAFRRRTLEPTEAPALPVSYLPLNVLLGAFLALLGWLAMLLSQPLAPAAPSPSRLVIDALLATGAAILATLAYGWLVRGEFDAGLTGRGILAAMVAISAGLTFIPSWACALIGVLAGLLLAPTMYIIEHVLRLEDPGAAISAHGMAALGGILSVGLFAASSGEGIGAGGATAAVAATSGMAGNLASTSGQLLAQAVGAGALLLLAAIMPLILMTLATQAYAFPPAARAKALARRAASRQERQQRERQARQGTRFSAGQKLQIAYLRVVSKSDVRRARRSRLPRPTTLVSGTLRHRRLRKRPSSQNEGQAKIGSRQSP